MLSVEKQILFLLSKVEHLLTQDLIRIYEKRGYSAASIRNALSRLKKENYIDAPSRSVYQIMDAGRAYIRSVNRKPLLYADVWDRSWHLVLISFPEAERKRRDQFRSDLLQTGFGLLHSGVYVSPWPYDEELSELLEKHVASAYVTVFSGELRYGKDIESKAEEIWSLDELRNLYEQKKIWFTNEFQPLLRSALKKLDESSSSMDQSLELFLLFLTLGEQMNELYLLDPMLPVELLPDNWIGRNLLEQMTAGLSEIVEAIPEGSAYAQFVK